MIPRRSGTPRGTENKPGGDRQERSAAVQQFADFLRERSVKPEQYAKDTYGAGRGRDLRRHGWQPAGMCLIIDLTS